MRFPLEMTMYRPVTVRKTVSQYVKWLAASSTLAFLSRATCEQVENLQHHTRDRDQHTELDPEDASMLTVHRVVREHEVVEVIAAEDEAGEAHARIQEDAEREECLDEPVGHDPPRLRQSVDQRIKDHRGGHDYSGLKPP